MNVAEKKETESLLHFGGFTLDLERRGLYRGPQRIHLTSKPLETLIYLVENRGRTIEKQRLLDEVWKDTFVTEDTLVHAIREVRRALGDDKDNPRFVQTVPRQGYRFVSEVSATQTSAFAPHDTPSQPGSFDESKWKTRYWLWVAPVLIFGAMLAGLLWLRHGSSGTSPAPGQPRVGAITNQITTGEFSSGKPAFSPDGKFLLYVSSGADTRGHGDLFIRQFLEGNAQRITNMVDPSGDLPVFTADGRHVVFSVARIGTDGARHHDLWIVPSFGGPPSRFIEDASGAGFSPDKKWVAYTRHLPSGKALWVSPLGNLEEHCEVSEGGYTPRWSPGGELLAYTTSDPNGGTGTIWTCRVYRSNDGQPHSSDHKQITRETEQIYGLTWTADAGAIIFSSKRAGSAQLYKVSTGDGSTTPLLVGVGQYGAPSASPDGNTVVFQYFRLTNDLLMATMRTNCEAKTITFDEFHRWPRISPSGDKLASVIRNIDNSERLYLTDLNTKVSSQLSDRMAQHPSWLNDDNVAFLTPGSSTGNSEVLIVNISTRETSSLTRFSSEADWLAIHPDGKRIAVVLKSADGKEKILLRDLGNKSDTTIHEGWEYEYLRWSPDGSALCWDRPGASKDAPRASGGIWVLKMGQSEPYLVARDAYCPVWSADGTALYFGMRQGQQGLWRHDLRQRKEELVCRWERVFSYDIVGSRLVYAQHRNDSQVYAMSLNQ